MSGNAWMCVPVQMNERECVFVSVCERERELENFNQ